MLFKFEITMSYKKNKRNLFIKKINKKIDDLFCIISTSNKYIEFPEELLYEKSIVKMEPEDVYNDLFEIGKFVNVSLDRFIYRAEDKKLPLKNKIEKCIVSDSFGFRDRLKLLFNKYGFIETSKKHCDFLELFSYLYNLYVLSSEPNKLFEYFDSIYPNYISVRCIEKEEDEEDDEEEEEEEEEKIYTSCLVFGNIFQYGLFSIKEKLISGKKNNMKECINCHRLFIPKRTNQLYCSRKENEKCYLERQNKRKIKSKSKK